MRTKSRSSTTTKRNAPVSRRLPTERPPTHPGEMLRAEFIEPLGITQTAFAARLGVSFPRLNAEILTYPGSMAMEFVFTNVARRLLPGTA